MEAANTALAHYILDVKASRFTVQALATGMLSAMGHSPTIAIRDFSGEVDFNPETPQASGFRISIKAASLSVQDDISDKDRREIERMMNEQVLETATYPDILYQAPSIAITPRRMHPRISTSRSPAWV